MNRKRIGEEKAVVEQMIRLYCRKHEGHTELCPICQQLLDKTVKPFNDYINRAVDYKED